MISPILWALVGPACTPDQGFIEKSVDMISVVSGDFDYVEENLDRLLVPFQLYEGYINGPTYDEDIEPDQILLDAETLFLGESAEGGLEINLFDVVFVNSGARGFAEYVYNGLEPDDSLVRDTEAITNVQNYVESGGVLVVSDWAYELVEAAWPDKIEFFGDDAALDAAQAGSVGRYTATVDEGLVEALGGETASVQYNYSYWTVIESVGEGVNTHLSADITYRVSASEGEGTLTGAPLLVSFAQGDGLVIFSTFHWNAQTAALSDALIAALVEGLPVNSAEDTGDE